VQLVSQPCQKAIDHSRAFSWSHSLSLPLPPSLSHPSLQIVVSLSLPHPHTHVSELPVSQQPPALFEKHLQVSFVGVRKRGQRSGVKLTNPPAHPPPQALPRDIRHGVCGCDDVTHTHTHTHIHTRMTQAEKEFIGTYSRGTHTHTDNKNTTVC